MQNCVSFLKEEIAVKCPGGHTLSAQWELLRYRWDTGVPIPPQDSYHSDSTSPWSLLLPVVVLAPVPRLCDCSQLCHPQKDT